MITVWPFMSVIIDHSASYKIHSFTPMSFSTRYTHPLTLPPSQAPPYEVPDLSPESASVIAVWSLIRLRSFEEAKVYPRSVKTCQGLKIQSPQI